MRRNYQQISKTNNNTPKGRTMKIIKSILAVVAGIIAGSIVNATLIYVGNAIFGSPEGMVLWDAESVKAHADKLTFANFASTLFAHQLGTLAGALVAARIAPFRKMVFAFVIGAWFLGGGIYAVSLIPAPVWFVIADFALYLPSAYMGGKLAGGRAQKSSEAI
jgi:hypothetical protein